MSDLSKSFRSSAPTREEPKTIFHEEWWKPNKHDRKVLTTLGIYTGAGLVFFFGAVAAVRLQRTPSGNDDAHDRLCPHLL